jgi:beta-fructofuranosidase
MRLEIARYDARHVNTDPARPSWHFAPRGGWLNDPNGLIHWRGQHHVFYQHNPSAARWGNIHWAHAVSSDLIHWQHLPHALHPDSSVDAAGCWSGSALEVGNELYLFYTATSMYDADADSSEPSIALAVSQDGMSFEKRGMVLPAPAPLTFLNAKPLEWMGWRDPVVWRDGERWLMTVGAGIRGRGGVVMLYESQTPEGWREVGELIAGDDAALESLELGQVWECPQLVRMDGADVLLLCPWADRRGFPPVVVLGHFDDSRLHVSSSQVLDAGDYFAPQVWKDATERWLMMGWVTEQRPTELQLEAGYSGCMAFVRELKLENGTLAQYPVAELEMLRGERLQGQITGRLLEIAVSWPVSVGEARMGVKLRASPQDDEFTLVYLESGELIVDRRHSSLSEHVRKDVRRVSVPNLEARGLRVFVDGSLIEVFCGGAAMAVRVYPVREDALEVHGLGSVRLEAWALKTPP